MAAVVIPVLDRCFDEAVTGDKADKFVDSAQVGICDAGGCLQIAPPAKVDSLTELEIPISAVEQVSELADYFMVCAHNL